MSILLTRSKAHHFISKHKIRQKGKRQKNYMNKEQLPFYQPQ